MVPRQIEWFVHFSVDSPLRIVQVDAILQIEIFHVPFYEKINEDVMESVCKCIDTGSIEELLLESADQNQSKKLALAINGMPKPVNVLIANFP